MKDALVKLGPTAYSVSFDKKLSAALGRVAAQKKIVANLQQHEPAIDRAERDLARAQQVRAVMGRGGATHYNVAFDQRLSQIDHEITTGEHQLAHLSSSRPQEHQAYRQELQAKVDANKELRKELLAKGPENYGPHDQAIASARANLEREKSTAAPYRQQLARVESTAATQDDVAKLFH